MKKLCVEIVNVGILMLPAARLTGLEYPSLNMHGTFMLYKHTSNPLLKSSPRHD